MQKIFVIADTHFFHNNIIEYENRPFRSVEHMNDAIIKNWNSVVSNRDKVYVLGDVSFANKEDTKGIITQLNGSKTLIIGNHDKPITQYWLDIGFKEVSKYPILYKDFIIMSHEPPEYIPGSSPYKYIYGHVHSTDMYRTVTKNSACVSIERWGYAPVELSKLFELMMIS